jgi:AcrR family transcriptional regulator
MAREKVLCGKEEIVRVAVGIVDREGMEALSVRRIAKELGVSSMTIYNYVENLQDIKKEVLINGFDRLYERIYLELNSLKMPLTSIHFARR